LWAANGTSEETISVSLVPVKDTRSLIWIKSDVARGLGVADMAFAIRNMRPPRASGDLMYHVHDIMHGIHDASREGRHVEIQSPVDRPAPFPAGLAVNIFE